MADQKLEGVVISISSRANCCHSGAGGGVNPSFDSEIEINATRATLPGTLFV